jgi:hypothetical protein
LNRLQLIESEISFRYEKWITIVVRFGDAINGLRVSLDAPTQRRASAFMTASKPGRLCSFAIYEEDRLPK